MELDYAAWKVLAGIDSIEYYRFIYPQDSIYRFSYLTQGSITQFAPFVVNRGVLQPIHVIYLDGKPVYFSWSTNVRPYSFNVDRGYHQIKLRTAFREITIDSLYFEKGKKMIFSLEQDLKNPHVKINEVDSKLSDFEKRLLYKYIVPYRHTFGEKYAFLKENENFQSLTPESRYGINNYAGSLVGDLTFQLVGGHSTRFRHEPFFEYEFSHGLLKMRSADKTAYPEHLYARKARSSLADNVLTPKIIEKQWRDYLDFKRSCTARYRYPNFTPQGAGKLLINLKRSDELVKEMPLNILIFRYDNHEFLRVYPGNTSLVHDLKKGYHKLLLFYSGAKYHVEDSVFIQPNGVNYYEIEQPTLYQKDVFSFSVSNMIEEILFKSKPYYEDEKRELKQLYNHYQQRFQYTGVGDVVEGYVYDETSGESLPGVSVIIKGTSYGTVTDAAGYYSIKVPSGNNSLNFSFIGYVSEDKPLGYDGVLNVKLSADMSNIEEVVVVGFSSQKQSYLVGSAYTVTSSRTLGGIPGVSGNISESLQGQVSGISISSNNEAPGSAVEFHIRGASSIKFEQAPLYIINGNVFTGDISELDPATIQGMQVLKDASATSIYGARAVNGVVIIETQPGAFKAASPMSKGADYDDAFLEAAAQAGSIRDNFSDYAFWEPSLVTDENGKASFEVTFPDDVTRWETFYFAMNGKRQSGQSKGSIKSYKPLMAQLAVPRFLVENDTSYAIGKVLNYTSDSIRVETRFEVDGQEMQNTSRFCNNSLIDTLPFFASTDSVELKYFIETEDNYFDGEQRKIPVFPQGLEVTKGDFYVLDKDTTIQLKCDSALGTVSLYARADILHVLDDEISYLIKYKYSCNEQLASKLKALLAEKNIAHYRGERFKNDNEIEKLIRLLKRNQNGNGLWGWWKVSKESLWISLHVLEALIHAEQLGYRSLVNKNKIAKLLIWELENSRYFNDKVRILKILNLLGTPINNQFYISNLERENKPSLNSLLSIIELKQLCGMDYDLDTLKHYEKSSMFGNIYYSDKKQETNLLNNDMQNTILAYKIFRSDSIVDAERLNKIQNYFLENRRNGYWRNTYESAQVIETILSDLLNRQLKAGKCQLTLTGSVDRVVSEFPFTMNVNSTANIEVSKTGGAPIYFTSYQKYWNNKPSLKMEDFEISTYFDDKQSSSLSVGKETKLIAKVIVKKDAEYVMINIPIPGACSYAHKRNNFRNESHREYFKNETTIFCDYLPKGEYTFEIALLPRYLGTFTINPAKIEMMYFPTFNANNEIKTIKIIEAE